MTNDGKPIPAEIKAGKTVVTGRPEKEKSTVPVQTEAENY